MIIQNSLFLLKSHQYNIPHSGVRSERGLEEVQKYYQKMKKNILLRVPIYEGATSFSFFHT